MHFSGEQKSFKIQILCIRDNKQVLQHETAKSLLMLQSFTRLKHTLHRMNYILKVIKHQTSNF